MGKRRRRISMENFPPKKTLLVLAVTLTYTLLVKESNLIMEILQMKRITI
jgi:hypothetical protein